MAIKQERILALLAEAESHREALVGLRAAFADAIKQCDETISGPELGLMLKYLLDVWPIPNNPIMAVERYHFMKFQRHNERERARATTRRRGLGIMPRRKHGTPGSADVAEFRAQMAEANEDLASDDIAAETGSIDEDAYAPTPEQVEADKRFEEETLKLRNLGLS